jgi:hypothetical protein
MGDNGVPDRERLRDGLRDSLLILRRLGKRCADIQQLDELISLAVGDEDVGVEPNDAQLMILLDIISPPPAEPPTQGRRAWQRSQAGG